jgi:hypothetical protein
MNGVSRKSGSLPNSSGIWRRAGDSYFFRLNE